MTSICPRCHQSLPPDAFYQLANGQRSSACKECQKRAVAEWRNANRARHNENARKWRDANKDKIRDTNRAQYEKNKTKHLAYGREWAKANPDKCRLAEKRWRAKPESKELMRQKQQKWRAENPDKRLAIERRWRQKNPRMVCSFAKTRRARKAGAPVNDFTAAQWAALQIAYDHRCVYCNKRRKGRLTQDHIVPLSKGGSHTASNIVPACSSCNSRKNVGPPPIPVQPKLLIP